MSSTLLNVVLHAGKKLWGSWNFLMFSLKLLNGKNRSPSWSLLTIVNEGLLLTIVNEGLTLTIITETMNFIKPVIVFIFSLSFSKRNDRFSKKWKRSIPRCDTLPESWSYRLNVYYKHGIQCVLHFILFWPRFSKKKPIALNSNYYYRISTYLWALGREIKWYGWKICPLLFLKFTLSRKL